MIFRIVLENETRYDIYTSCHMIRTTTEPFDGYIVTMNDEEEKFIPERHVKYAFMYRSVLDKPIYKPAKYYQKSVREAMYFTGEEDNKKAILEWLKEAGILKSFRNSEMRETVYLLEGNDGALSIELTPDRYIVLTSDGTIYTMHEKNFNRLYKPLGQKGD